MRTLQALLGLFAAAVFFLAGLFFLVLPFQQPLRLRVADALLQEPQLFTPVGVALLGVALVLGCGFYFAHRGRFFVLRMGDRHVAVDPHVIGQALRPLLLRQFPGKVALRDVEIAGQGLLEIRLLLAAPESADSMLPVLERAFQLLLAKQFGYRRPFKVVAEI